MSTPRVSVVMSVYNGAARLPETLSSVLGQADCDFEFIVVNDGSSDESPRILDEHAARDSRLRVLHQDNTGLTRALARGCAEARGEFIARQDAGDRSLPGRLAAQSAFLGAHPQAVMCACGVQVSGPDGERLYEVLMPGEELDRGLRSREVSGLRGPPHHGGTMFRRDAYAASGGYRLPFQVAQDIDLWLRLAEQGECLGMDEVLYESSLEAGSISSRRRDDQLRLAELALDCAAARREGRSEQAVIDAFPKPGPKGSAAPDRAERARFHYFIGSCLRDRDGAAARRYFRLAVRDNPFHFKALIRLLAG